MNCLSRIKSLQLNPSSCGLIVSKGVILLFSVHCSSDVQFVGNSITLHFMELQVFSHHWLPFLHQSVCMLHLQKTHSMVNQPPHLPSDQALPAKTLKMKSIQMRPCTYALQSTTPWLCATVSLTQLFWKLLSLLSTMVKSQKRQTYLLMKVHLFHTSPHS